MPKYLIEREIPGAGSMSKEELRTLARRSCEILEDMGPKIQWIESFVAQDKVYCIYIAPNEDMLREHAGRGRFPVNRISQIKSEISPVTAEI